MFKRLLIILIIFLIVIFLIIVSYSNKILVVVNSDLLKFVNSSSDINILFLGKPGPGHIGSENTDSIIVIHYNKNRNEFFLIPIPRDLIISDDEGKLQKINALYGEKKINLLLNKASAFTGFDIPYYFVVNLNLVSEIVDFLGGLEVYLKEPIVDAATLYTLPKGKQKLNGYLIELVLRSRYNHEGDFFRIKNQIEVLRALKERILSLNIQEKLDLIKFVLDQNKYSIDTNLTKNDLLSLVARIDNLQTAKITPLIINLRSGFLTSGSFKIGNFYNVYGIYPIAGIDNYRYLRSYIQSQIKNNN